ncbi:hypothetical protein M569_05435, partial [Genlisea aurea]
SSAPAKTGVVVVGGGLAGLAAAIRLQEEKVPYVLLEASDGVGGRVRTDFVDGFTLDRGFQIFITAYPEARKLIDYETLDLQRFYSGATVFFDGGFHTVADPLRHLSDALRSLANPVGTAVDKFLIGLTRIRVTAFSDEEIFRGDDSKTIELLNRIGFSDSILDRFFRPFFGGIFFDPELETTSRLFNFVFKCLALGDSTLPKNGISAIPEQLAAKLDPGSIRLNSRVISIDSDSENNTVLKLHNGEILQPSLGTILAVEESEALALLSVEAPPKKPFRSTVCIYFSTDAAKVPTDDPILFLNGSSHGIVNNMFFATNVAPSYAPPGKALVSVSLIGSYPDVEDEELADRVLNELGCWFGDEAVSSWSLLKIYRIDYAQPNQSPPSELLKDPKVREGLYVCGDYVANATFDGALVSGRRAAEALLK